MSIKAEFRSDLFQDIGDRGGSASSSYSAKRVGHAMATCEGRWMSGLSCVTCLPPRPGVGFESDWEPPCQAETHSSGAVPRIKAKPGARQAYES